ncbi:MAG TPA: carboxypeptidase-like regulatory domain-containing protein [Terriglobales bacterium]|nr:carboxypeptidase-like regulatory domain-containing protein [Terriglobales bacterium]
MRRAALALVLLFSLQSIAGFAGDKKFCDLSFVVLKDSTGKPVKYASVILHGVDSRGRQLHEGMQLKTDGEGRTRASGVPYGKVRVQVIATGLQTYGEDFDLNEPEREITIKLKQPQGQYSIYGNPPRQ